MRFFLLTFIALLGLSSTAQADVVSAGEPETVRVNTSPEFRYPDIRQRQLDYRDKRLMLRADLEARQKAFAAPSQISKERYAESLSEMYKDMEENEGF